MNDFVDSRRAEVSASCRRLRVKRLVVFGSAARGLFNHASSDVDFLVEFEPLPPPEYADAYFSLKEQLESLFGRPVDLLTAGSLRNPHLRASIESSRQQVYAA